MIAQKSSKSNIYHRPECKYVNRIEEKSLITFDFEDAQEDIRPCKYCCNMKRLFENYRPCIREAFPDLDIEINYEKDEVFIHTKEYDWKMALKESTQNIALYRREFGHDGESVHYLKIRDMDSTRNVAPVMRYIANEEKLAVYPEMYREQAIQIVKYAEEKGLQIEFDGTDLYVLTKSAVWKIAYGYHKNWFKLLHNPFDEETMTIEDAKTAHYHVQMDVPRNQTPYKHIQYIYKHDVAKEIENKSYKLLPQNTRKQKMYYRQAERRAKRNSVNRVMDLFAQLEGSVGVAL